MQELDRPAPGALESVRAFLNTLDVEEATDALATPAGLGAWLHGHGLATERRRFTRADAERARALREALRTLLLARAGDGPSPAQAERAAGAINAVADAGGLCLELGADGGSLVRGREPSVDGALAELIARVHRAQMAGTWDRLKVCPDATCHWAFYDGSRNRSSRWCNMGVCGNRHKVRAFRERRAG